MRRNGHDICRHKMWTGWLATSPMKIPFFYTYNNVSVPYNLNKGKVLLFFLCRFLLEAPLLSMRAIVSSANFYCEAIAGGPSLTFCGMRASSSVDDVSKALGAHFKNFCISYR